MPDAHEQTLSPTPEPLETADQNGTTDERPRRVEPGEGDPQPLETDFAALVKQLEKTDSAARSRDWAPQLLSAAAHQAGSRGELKQLLQRLEGLGYDDLNELDLESMVRIVAERMPDWYLDPGPEGPPPGTPASAIERLVALVDDGHERSQRLEETVALAVDHFNAGHLGRALAIFDVVERLMSRSDLDPADRSRIRCSARGRLQLERFEQASRQPETHHELHQVLDFFPDLRVETLTRRLQREEDRRRRHFILDLLRIHGDGARAAAADLLVTSLTLTGSKWPWYFVRNLIHLLRTIPANQESIGEEEIGGVVQYTDPSYAIQVVREAIAYLGAVEHPAATGALIDRLHLLISTPRELRAGAEEELERIQSLVFSQLLRLDGEARSTALDFLLDSHRRSSSSAALLRGLGKVNLAADETALDRLLEAARSLLPGQRWTPSRLLGLGSQKEEALAALLQALGGTPAPEVRELLEQVEELEPSPELARLAADLRERLEELAIHEDVTAQEMEGDLEEFGLPSLIQSLILDQASGLLTLETKRRERRVSIRFDRGRFVDAKVGALRGIEAIYLLIEKPLATRFWFAADPSTEVSGSPRDFGPILLEGMRRHDELERLRLLIPDSTPLELAARRPTAPPATSDEREDGLLQGLWTVIREGGMTAVACDDCGLADPYRVRRLLGHWFEAEVLRSSPLTTGR